MCVRMEHNWDIQRSGVHSETTKGYYIMQKINPEEAMQKCLVINPKAIVALQVI